MSDILTLLTTPGAFLTSHIVICAIMAPSPPPPPAYFLYFKESVNKAILQGNMPPKHLASARLHYYYFFYVRNKLFKTK